MATLAFLFAPQRPYALVVEPIVANYPNCSVKVVPVKSDRLDLEKHSASVVLTPDLFPILRHTQFEDLLNGKFADPINGVLRAIRPGPDVDCRIVITVRPAGDRLRHRALNAIRLLDREFFRKHHRLASYFARNALRGNGRVWAILVGILARQTAAPHRSALETSASRLHDREEDLQAAAEKIGGHLFETRIQIILLAPANLGAQNLDRMRQILGALGAFTKSRLATFRVEQRS